MISYPVDILLLAALVATTVCVVMLYRRLSRLDRLNADYGRALEDAAKALTAARDSLQTFSSDGREVLTKLSSRIEDAHGVIAELDARAGIPGAKVKQH
ncbi:hypothetical protein [Xanthobacter agilis]|jgi:hypothetical protein|uniref:Uncharacterized protein n=1 Tax=Xanthobacter agilis TaxID=47492 RepID=A0ABU0LHR5_XANAG|nr:hypothetical protein [Xanthobacter agilis]MDQ0506675.1 hypothetical protein [Xanthobacter agilis]